jgi:hypothetical protein
MPVTKNIGMLLLAIWLIATGLLTFIPVLSVHAPFVLAALALAAGICILIGK